jgi:hypothetical protein
MPIAELATELAAELATELARPFPNGRKTSSDVTMIASKPAQRVLIQP